MPEATMLKTSDFDFALPQELIAQTPIEPRDASRLMTLDRRTGRVGHGQFRDILELLTPKDCLILNDSRVLPARIFGTKTGNGPAGGPACPGGAVSPETGAPGGVVSPETGATGGVVSPETGAPGGNVEFLLLENKGDDTWEALCKPGRRAKEGSCFQFGGGLLCGRIVGVNEDGSRMVRFEYEGEFFSLLEQIGQMPLPPYIKEKLRDSERYQTVYSRQAGSAAAPTAGLHFTKELLCQLREKGVEQGFVTLHVGLGTFRPVSAENILEHKMHTEHYHLPAQTADLINRTRARGGRVIAVGTTSCRAIESAARAPGFTGEFSEAEGYTGIFLYPGCEFLGIDGLITNFHLPKSTLIMLVSALAGREHVLAAYAQAVQRGYRFFSFGDAMLVV